MKKQRILCGLLCAALALSATACGDGGASTPASSGNGGNSATPASQGGTSTPASDGDAYTTVTAFCPNTSSMPMTNDILVLKTLGEKTKTNFEFTVSPTTGSEEKFNLMMASGEIPDMVIYVEAPILKYTKAFAPLNDLIDEYCPNYAKLMEENPSLRKDLTAADGNIYTIQSKAAFKFANGIIVRQDWLDKLGLEVPTTLDEYYNVLKAFKEQDPNGNGEADEIPFLSSTCPDRRYDTESPGISIFDACWGIDEDFYVSEDGKEILFGAVDPKMKEALAYLNKLYSEGLIDAEYLTRDSASYEGLISEEKAGMWTAWGIAVDDTSIQNPESELNVILPPTGVDGKLRVYSQMPQTRTNALAVSKDSQVKEHIMGVWDYFFSEEGTMLANFGVEGETYEMVDGQPKYLDKFFGGDVGPMNMLRREGVNTWLPHNQVKEAEFGRASQKFADAVEEYDKYIVAPVPPLKFTDEEKSAITSTYTGEIKTYMNEMIDGFITGKTPLDQFDAFVEQMNKMGLPDIMKIYNDAYARYLES